MYQINLRNVKVGVHKIQREIVLKVHVATKGENETEREVTEIRTNRANTNSPFQNIGRPQMEEITRVIISTHTFPSKHYDSWLHKRSSKKWLLTC